MVSVNFTFLSTHGAQLARLGTQAERYFAEDANVCLFKLRQFGEVLAQTVAAKAGLWTSATEPQNDLLRRLRDERVLTPQVADYFHRLRKAGNEAVHDFKDDQREALTALKIARALGLWYHRTVTRNPAFDPGPFVPPAPPADPTQELRGELARLQAELDASRDEAARHQTRLKEEADRRQTAEQTAAAAERERAEWEALAQQVEADHRRLQDEMAATQAATVAAGPAASANYIALAQSAAAHVDLDERETRRLIDAKLRQAGWEADSERLTFKAGARPQKGRNLAIAEWPTANGPADYVLFVGLTPVGVVEAKRQRADVSAAVGQAARYSKGFRTDAAIMNVAHGPWDEHRVPFLFATNGRRFHRQFLIASGIWFRDARRSTNLARALEDWPTPDGLLAELERDAEAADAALRAHSFEFAFGLRDYQVRAVQAVEGAIAAGRRDILLAMATGTGKTKTCIALVYRLLATKRFRRILFLVDRNALGEQAAGAFKETHITSAQTFADIFGIKEVKDTAPDTDTKVQIATVQAMVRRVVNQDADSLPPVDQFDCIVIDECHRGYLLDQEMGEEELAYRDLDDYVSKYRQVLDRFDAVKIGLTATPAVHTADIFGQPVYRYTYREAVVDGWLIDHDTPLTPRTRLKEAGIAWAAGDDVEVLDTGTGAVDTVTLPDELRFAVEDFNRRVVTREFNRVVAGWLAEKIDPTLPGKTLVFAANDLHADIIVDELKKAFAAQYGEVDDEAVRKITGKADKPMDLIRLYKNERLPSVAVTVDLLTTGIDVPEIVNLVFVRRVNSRILYEQMIGRATRPCDAIGKDVFRIFDAVGLYATMERVSAMKPVAADPNISFSKLAEELAAHCDAPRNESTAETKGAEDGKGRYLLDQFLAKLQRRRRAFSEAARQRFHDAIGQSPEQFAQTLHHASPAEAAQLFTRHPELIDILDGRGRYGRGTATMLPISDHPDEYLGEEETYGEGVSRPDDFLDAFTRFIRDNVNTIPALTVAVQRPRDLTRAQLKELSLLLDKAGYREKDLENAWARQSNAAMAARIVGYIRRAAIGDPLIPYDRRVDDALQRITARHGFKGAQRDWLLKIAAQMKREVVVDRAALDSGLFQADGGGFRRLDRVFGGKLEDVLGELSDEVWRQTG